MRYPAAAVMPPSPSTPYDAVFHDRAAAAASRAAPLVIQALRGLGSIRSVADFGCSRGAWLSAWRSAGATTVLGIDGAPSAGTLLRAEEFQHRDLAQPIDL